VHFDQTPYFTPTPLHSMLPLSFPIPQALAYVPQPTWGQVVGRVLLIAGAGYLLYKALETPKAKRRCSECGRTSHIASNCPYVGERRPFSSVVVKTGWCECCGYRFSKTQLHHWGGRADDSRPMEMCGGCHIHCGHNGHTQSFAIKPRYCRLAA
jgi:hypothetical protein